MARKARDYAAEQRRRNELARARGFTSRGQQRRAIERGRIPPLQPQRVRSPKTIQAQTERLRGEAQKAQQRIERLVSEDSQAKRMGENELYSQAHANRQIAKFDYKNAVTGVSLAEFTDAYWNAFVNPKGGYDRVRRRGGSRALKHYFVTITGHFTADEYETRYGHAR